MEQAPSAVEQGKRLDDFLLCEYDNIAEAHFKTIETISEFLKHYLTIISIPLTILIIIVNVFSRQAAASSAVPQAVSVFGILFGIISFVGMMVLWYVTNLRMDALLYARTVNGIRKYFYDQDARLDLPTKNKLRVLPQSPLLPIYREFSFFGPLVLIFSSLNTVYFFLACGGLAFSAGAPTPFSNQVVIGLTALFFTSHVGIYLFVARYREDAYLRSGVLGVDIDGVLNRHREQFCRLLSINANKNITEDQITTIPVHDCPGIGITREDEKTVFNDPQYWIEMPVMADAAGTLQRLQTSMGLKIHIFTHRPWPATVNVPPTESKEITHRWTVASEIYSSRVHQSASWWSRVVSWVNSARQIFPYRILRLPMLLGKESHIDKITKAWLVEHGFKYDRLVIEKGGEDAADPSSHVLNRFYASRIVPIRYFVEDDLTKAKKLAFICDVVFLIDHPYNQTDELPNNIVRVQSWDELLHHMRAIW